MSKTRRDALTPAPPQSGASIGRLSQGEVVALAAYLLGGDRRVLDTEDIAVKANEIAPGRFTWRKYEHQINLELVRVYLSDAKKKAKGALITGSGKTGWTLTPAGRAWVRGPGNEFLGERTMTLAARSARTASPTTTRQQRERLRIVTTPAWSRWTKKEEISAREAAEVFRIDSYARGRIRDLKFGRMRQMFEDDPELGAFIRKLAELIEGREDTP